MKLLGNYLSSFWPIIAVAAGIAHNETNNSSVFFLFFFAEVNAICDNISANPILHPTCSIHKDFFF